MKIRSVQVYPLENQPHGEHGLVRVDTDEGLYGWGSCYTTGDLVKSSLKDLSPLIVGESALEPERVTEKLHQETFWYGRGGVLTTFISGINIALWDIYGKATGQSVSRLLGGRFRERIKPYASQIFSWPVDEMVERLRSAKARGFRAFKLGWRPFGRLDARTDEALVKAAREAIGDECDLMVDAGGSDAFWHNDLKWAINAAHMLKHYNVVWFEEALTDGDIEGFKMLRQASPVWIATGECLRKRQTFYPWIFQRAVDVLQPDQTTCGGISEGRRIAWTANDHGILVVFHGWNTAVGVAADLQTSAALSQARWVEFLTPTAYIDDILVDPFKLDKEGYLPIPDKPGLGIELDLSAVKRFAAQ
ncbi:MAG: mandelate racemase/muconate lactonizing enzyme family protein [Chloroflexota bacterium]|nr:mandelate racemase/muconate lactonizing enzyme family protein [Chloroflexota bacterium]